jgi:2-oxoglutarate ferredoxin oxidoreductase subunit beta
MAIASGASYVARTTSYHFQEITKYLKQAINHKGFSVVEILSPCPTHFGRRNKLGGAVDMLEYLRDNTAQFGSKALEENPELIGRGVFVHKDTPEYCSEYDRLIQAAHKG